MGNILKKNGHLKMLLTSRRSRWLCHISPTTGPRWAKCSWSWGARIRISLATSKRTCVSQSPPTGTRGPSLIRASLPGSKKNGIATWFFKWSGVGLEGTCPLSFTYAFRQYGPQCAEYIFKSILFNEIYAWRCNEQVNIHLGGGFTQNGEQATIYSDEDAHQQEVYWRIHVSLGFKELIRPLS